MCFAVMCFDVKSCVQDHRMNGRADSEGAFRDNPDPEPLLPTWTLMPFLADQHVQYSSPITLKSAALMLSHSFQDKVYISLQSSSVTAAERLLLSFTKIEKDNAGKNWKQPNSLAHFRCKRGRDQSLCDSAALSTQLTIPWDLRASKIDQQQEENSCCCGNQLMTHPEYQVAGAERLQ